MERKLLGYLPEIMREIREFKEIMEAEEPEFKVLYEKIDRAVENCFVDTLDEYGCLRWERILNIVAKDGDEIDFRRLRIKAALNGDTPYTLRSLDGKLRNICGEGNYSLRYANDIYTLSVGIGLRAKRQFEFVKGLLGEIVPANIIIDVRVLYNTHGTLRKFRHGELRGKRHRELCEEEL